MQKFLVLRIMKCMLEVLLCHFSYLLSIWKRYRQHLPRGNYICHPSTRKEVLSFQLSHLHKCLTFQTQSQFIAIFLVIFMMPISFSSDRWQNNLVDWFSALVVQQENEALLLPFTDISSFSFVAFVLNQPSDKDKGFAHTGSWSLLLIYRRLLLLCNAAHSALKKHPLLWTITDSIVFLLSITLQGDPVIPWLLPWRTATPMHDRKADSTLKMTLVYQNNSSAKYSMQSACLSLGEKPQMTVNSKRCSAFRRHPGNVNINSSSFEKAQIRTLRRHKIHGG